MKPDFLWGAATSSHQIDGYNQHSDWWHWELTGAIENKEKSGCATDHWNRYKEDLEHAKELGLNSYRFSIEWARIEPREGQFDESALDWYEKLLTECERLHLLPMATLHHFTIPKWLYDRGGFTYPDVSRLFERYSRHVVKRIGSRIPLWSVLNEPMNLTIGQYVGGYMPPAVFKPELVGVACHHMLRCHVKAYHLIHSEIQRRTGPFRTHPLMVGIAHNMIDFIPGNRWNPMERLIVQVLRRFYNRSWLDAVTGLRQHFGVKGLLPYGEIVESAMGTRTVDFIGVNYYTKAYILWNMATSKETLDGFIPVVENSKLPFTVSLMKKGEEASDMGWSIHPKGLGRMLRFVKSYGLPIYVTENGIADSNDSRRSTYLKTHLTEIANEISQGADIRGYYYWSLLDNFEWIKGFTPRFGLIQVDYENMSRKVRKSATHYTKVIEAHKHGRTKPVIELINSAFNS